MADKLENALNSASDAAYVRAVDSSGNSIQISKADLASILSQQVVLAGTQDNVFVMFHRNSDNFPLAVAPDKWTSYQNSGEVADGVLVADGGRLLVVAPTEASCFWSSASVSGGGVTTANRLDVLIDLEGKANTTAQIAHSECSGAEYAPGFCAAYSRENANGSGLTAGQWWLPSIGELMMIYANQKKINYVLSMITGATQIRGSWYWSSTEYNINGAWLLDTGNCYLDYASKAQFTSNVRPVSAFLK